MGLGVGEGSPAEARGWGRPSRQAAWTSPAGTRKRKVCRGQQARGYPSHM